MSFGRDSGRFASAGIDRPSLVAHVLSPQRVDGISIESLRHQAQAPDKSGPGSGP